MRIFTRAAILAALTLFGAKMPNAFAIDGPKSESDAGPKSDFNLPPLPAEAKVTQSAVVDGATLKYTVSIGALPVRDAKGKTTGEVVYTAYTMAGANRPVTFALNGGPGASSVYLNLGAIGPKKVKFGVEGDSPSADPTLHDNPDT